MTGVQAGTRPDPGTASDLAEFIVLLERLRMAAGNPSLRDLAKRVGPLMRPPQQVPKSTVSDVFQPGRRRLNQDLVVALVRALGLDEEAVGQWREACIRVHSEIRAGGSAPAVRQLPAELATFTGREAEVASLLAAAVGPGDGPARTVVISAIEGMAGVGKTQLAVHVAHELVRRGHYADAQLYANLRGFDPSPPAEAAEVLERFLQALGVPEHRIPGSAEARSALFRDQLFDREALILLDNVAEESQVRELIPAGPKCLVLITSRRTLAGLEGGSAHRLDVFDRGDALALLARIAGAERVAAEPAAAERIAQACGHLPLALTLAAARLRSRPTWSLADLAERLREGGLDALEAGSATIRPVFELSYQGLSDLGRTVFRSLSLHPGADFDDSAIAVLCDLPVATVRRAVAELLDQHLLQELRSHRYCLHDLLRAFALDVLDRDADEPVRQAALDRLFGYYRFTTASAEVAAGLRPVMSPAVAAADPPPGARLTFRDQAEAMGWLQTEHRNHLAVIEAAAAADRPQDVCDLAGVTAYLRYHGPFDALLRLHTLAAAAARRLDDGDAVSRSLQAIGIVHGRQGRYRKAREAFEQGLALCTDPVQSAALLGGLGSADIELGRLAQSIAWNRRALEASRATKDARRERTTLSNLAFSFFLSGRYQDAAAYCRKGLALPDDGMPQVEEFVTLALIDERRGDYVQAAHHVELALANSRVRADGWAHAHVLWAQGLVQAGLGDTATAWESFQASLLLHREGGNRGGESDTLNALGNLLVRGDRTSEAAEHFRQAEVIAIDLESPRRQAEARFGLGEVELANGDHSAARSTLRRALQLSLAAEDPYRQARTRDLLARAEASPP